MGRHVLGGNGSLATGMWGDPKLCTNLAEAHLRHRAGRGAKVPSVTLVTAPAPLGSSTLSGLPKSCKGSGSYEHKARVGGSWALGGSDTDPRGALGAGTTGMPLQGCCGSSGAVLGPAPLSIPRLQGAQEKAESFMRPAL